MEVCLCKFYDLQDSERVNISDSERIYCLTKDHIKSSNVQVIYSMLSGTDCKSSVLYYFLRKCNMKLLIKTHEWNSIRHILHTVGAIFHFIHITDNYGNRIKEHFIRHYYVYCVYSFIASSCL